MFAEHIFHGGLPRGDYKDTLFGRRGELVCQEPWRRNLIVDGLRRLLAALVMDDPQGASLAFWAATRL